MGFRPSRASAIRASLVVLPVLGGIVAAPASAGADDKQACIAAYEQAQTLRKETKLRAAREQLMVCAREACPAVLKKDCTQWLVEVDQSLPSVVIEARGPDGSELVEVKVLVDGQQVAARMDGRAIPMDPGPHTFRFVWGSSAPVEERVVIREGEKNRKLLAKFAAAAAPPPATPAAAASAKPAPDDVPPPPPVDTGPTRPVPVAVWILGGVGVVALGSFAYFGLSGKADVRNKLDPCKGTCPQEDVDAVKRKLVLADVSLGVGAIALGAATYLYVTRPKRAAQEGAGIGIVPVPGGAVAGYGGTF